jgi:hypothetical protein
MRSPWTNQTFNHLLTMLGLYQANCGWGDADAHMVDFVRELMKQHRY